MEQLASMAEPSPPTDPPPPPGVCGGISAEGAVGQRARAPKRGQARPVAMRDGIVVDGASAHGKGAVKVLQCPSLSVVVVPGLPVDCGIAADPAVHDRETAEFEFDAATKSTDVADDGAVQERGRAVVVEQSPAVAQGIGVGAEGAAGQREGALGDGFDAAAALIGTDGRNCR